MLAMRSYLVCQKWDFTCFRLCRRMFNDEVKTDLMGKPFEDIPGPKSLPIIGTIHNYIPLIGQYRFDRLHHNGFLKLKQFGPLVREEIVPGINVVWVFTPEDIEEVFKNEGRYPERRSHLAILKYREERPEIYNTGGLLPTNGKEWWRLRSIFQKALSRPQNVKLYINTTDAVIQEFAHLIKNHCKKGNGFYDYLPYLSHLFLELVGLVAFDVRLNSLTENGLDPHSQQSCLIKAAETANSCVIALDNGLQLWRKFETPLYRKLKKSLEFMESVAFKLVSEKAAALQKMGNTSDHQPSLLELFLSSPDLDHKDIVGMAVDMLLAGMDTTSFSSCFALYHLAKNPGSQKILHEEALKLLPERYSPVTYDVLSNAHYTKAVLKETFRLNPVSVGIGRILSQDTILSGYIVPKGTVVVTQNQVTCQLSEYFPDPMQFIPERWLKNNLSYRQLSPYLVLPFGHGPRSCIARRLAEQNLQILLLKLVRQFHIGWDGDELDVRTMPVNKPDKPVKLTFNEL